jgi:hypothetical protein
MVSFWPWKVSFRPALTASNYRFTYPPTPLTLPTPSPPPFSSWLSLTSGFLCAQTERRLLAGLIRKGSLGPLEKDHNHSVSPRMDPPAVPQDQAPGHSIHFLCLPRQRHRSAPGCGISKPRALGMDGYGWRTRSVSLLSFPILLVARFTRSLSWDLRTCRTHKHAPSLRRVTCPPFPSFMCP